MAELSAFLDQITGLDNFERYAVAVCLLLTWVSATGKGQFCAAVVSLNWLAWSLMITLSGNFDPWAFGIALDGFSAWLLLRASSRSRALLAISYCTQIAAHIAYRLTVDPNPDTYYWSLSLIGWLQLLSVGVWSGGDWILHIRDRLALSARETGLRCASAWRAYAAG